MANRPVAEVQVDDALVGRLLGAQFPELASLPRRELSRGWDNTMFRLGDDLLIRLPHREVAAPLIEHEQRWLPQIADLVDLGVPAPTHCGTPVETYPWPWSVTPFFAGQEAASAVLNDPAATARTLGTFFRQLHVPAPDDAPRNPYRGVPLANRREAFATNLASIAALIDVQRAEALFEAGCEAPHAEERVWLHGDLHGRNMVVGDGELIAAIDWGDMCHGDRATDLSAAFMLVPDHVDLVMQIAGASEPDIVRARGWAANFAAVYLAHSDDDPVMRSVGLRLFDAALAASAD